MKYLSKVLEVETINLACLMSRTPDEARMEAEKTMLLFETDPSYGFSEKIIRWTFLYANESHLHPRFKTFQAKVRVVTTNNWFVKADSRDEALNKTQQLLFKKEEANKHAPYRWTVLTISPCI